MNQKLFETKILSEAIVFVALSGVLYSVRPFSLPYGGPVTLGSMVPIMWLSLRRGPKIGIFAGAVFGLLALPIDVLLLPNSPIANPAQVFLDYPLAFSMLGLVGFLKGKSGQTKGLAKAGICALVSAFCFVGAILQRARYNASFLVPEFIISGILIYLLIKRRTVEIGL